MNRREECIGLDGKKLPNLWIRVAWPPNCQRKKFGLSFKAELEVPFRKRLALGPSFKEKIHDPKKNVF